MKPTKTYPLVVDLTKAISSEVQTVGQNSVDVLSSMLHIRDPARTLTSQKVTEVKRKRREKRNKKSSFVKKILFHHQYLDMKVTELIACYCRSTNSFKPCQGSASSPY